MIQNKNKLSEVGLEPDKPAGHIRAIWALTLIFSFALIIGGGVYFILWCSPWGENVLVNKSQRTPSPTATLSGSPSTSSDYSTYTEKARGSFSFEYPKDWSILKTNPYDADAESLEIIYKSGDVLNTSYIIIEDHKNETGATDVRQAAGNLLPAANFVTDSQLGGKDAVKASEMEGMPPMTEYFALNGSYLIILMGRNYEGDTNLSAADQKNKVAFEYILESWKWL